MTCPKCGWDEYEKGVCRFCQPARHFQVIEVKPLNPKPTFENARSRALMVASLSTRSQNWLIVDIEKWKFRFERMVDGWKLYDWEEVTL